MILLSSCRLYSTLLCQGGMNLQNFLQCVLCATIILNSYCFLKNFEFWITSIGNQAWSNLKRQQLGKGIWMLLWRLNHRHTASVFKNQKKKAAPRSLLRYALMCLPTPLLPFPSSTHHFLPLFIRITMSIARVIAKFCCHFSSLPFSALRLWVSQPHLMF